MRRILLCILLTGMIVFGLVGLAEARTYGDPGSMKTGEYKYVENPDGTYTEYYKGNTAELPVRGDTYTAEGIDESDRVFSQVGVDEGTTGQNGSIVEGATTDNEYGAEGVTKAFRTNKPYTTPGEAEVGDELIDEGIAEDTLPSLPELVSAASGSVLTGGGVILAGVALGAGIDQLLGVVEFGEILGGSPSISPGCAYEYESDCKWASIWTPEVRLGEVGLCEQHEFLYPFEIIHLATTEEICEYPEVHFEELDEYIDTFGESHEVDNICSGWAGQGGDFQYSFETTSTCKTLVPEECVFVMVSVCERFFSGPEGKLWTEPQVGYSYEYARIWEGLFEGFSFGSFPGDEGLKSHESHIAVPPPHTIPAKPEVPEQKPPPPATVPAPARHKIIEKAKKPETTKEKEEEEKGKKAIPKPLIPPIEEGSEIPDPSRPVVPQPKPGGELFPDYAKDVERAGFSVTPESYTLPEGDIDTEVGPGDVAEPDISPEPGTSADPGTKIRVGVNPADAPPPGGHKPIGGPTEPGINLPHLTLLCTVFPFGVPCWLKEQLQAFSASSAAPVWTIGPIEWDGHKIPKAEIHLSNIESIMELVRPFMIIFGGIGIVFFFYKVFTGNSIGGGENPRGEVPGPEGLPQPDEDVYL